MKLSKSDRSDIILKSEKFGDDSVIFDGDMTSSLFDVTSNIWWRHNSVIFDSNV